MGFAERVRAARTFERARYKRFCVDGVEIGHVRHDLCEHLRRFRDIFSFSDDAVTFARSLTGRDGRSAAMADVAMELAARRLLTAWRNETYDIRKPESNICYFALERAAVRFFGFTAHAVHVNGLAERSGRRCMWIARRSEDKAIDAGMLDNMVGGGLASGMSVAQTLVKESWEEAGIPAHLASLADAAGSLQIVREVPEGLHAEVIYLHDLLLPSHFEPANQDGEVSELRLMTLEEVRDAIEGDARFTVDAALVAMDCLVRQGVLDRCWSDAIRARVLPY